MGTRVSTRGRTRTWTDDIWAGLSPVTGTAAQFAEDGFVGPFTPAQLAEFFWRVKEITVSWEITYDPGDGEATSSGSVGLVRQTAESVGVMDESDLIPANPPTHLHYASYQYFWDDVDTDYAFYVTITNGVWDRDENGKFWLQLVINVGAETGWAWTGFDEEGGVSAPSTLNLTTGSVSIPTRADAPGTISAATVTVTITEWFPYKTTAGAPAWNNATGEPANGGPGA